MTLQSLRGRIDKMTANRPSEIPNPPNNVEAFKQAGRLFLPVWACDPQTPEQREWWDKYGLKDWDWI